MVLPIKVGCLNLLGRLTQAPCDHLCKRPLKLFHLLGYSAELLAITPRPPTYIVQHQACIGRHIERLPAKRDDSRHRCSDTINIYGEISRTISKRLINSQPTIDLATSAIDTDVDLIIGARKLKESRDDISSGDL